jgi:hypothetical protein
MEHARILPGFWHARCEVIARRAIFHQWEQLEATGCIGNFRIAAGESGGFRQGLFFADSDAYKWLEAASRAWATTRDPHLGALADELVALVGRAQLPDGYLFTYNQVHFPDVRWRNLQVEHELYCHGHLIEAGVSRFQSTGRPDLLAIARRAADRIVADFADKGPAWTPGHEEIEIALLRLHEVTPGDQAYLDLARRFIEQRGRAPRFGRRVLREWVDTVRRLGAVGRQARAYARAHPGWRLPPVVPDNRARGPLGAGLRWVGGILDGTYNQQHRPSREQAVPVGHAVRFGYLETAVAMLARTSGDRSNLPVLEQAWDRMVERRMYLTGGLGSLPLLEGFGNDWELDPWFAYAETCAALASMFWSWEMVLLTGEAKYGDLFEWQLYNAAGVGMGLHGDAWFYNNPLACRGDVVRKAWYRVPCCPPNVARTLADLGRYVYSIAAGEITVHQYVASELVDAAIGLEDGGSARVRLKMDSVLPWEDRARIEFVEVDTAGTTRPAAFALRLRQPSWGGLMTVSVNGSVVAGDGPSRPTGAASGGGPTACGYDPRRSAFVPVCRAWSTGDVVEIRFAMPVELRTAHPRVRGHRGKVAVTRGPLVYCLESVDNPGVDIFSTRLETTALDPVFDPGLLGGTVCIRGRSRGGAPLTFIPYYLWGNRGPSRMITWVQT